MRRLLLVAILLVGLTLTLTACGGDDAPDTAPVSTVEAGAKLALTGARTTIDIDGITGGVLSGSGVSIEPVDPATVKDSSFDIPIVGGEITSGTLTGVIEHEGGIAFVAGDKRIEYTDLRIDTAAEQVLAGTNGSTPIFDLDVTDLTRTEDSGTIVVRGAVALVGTDAAAELNDGLEVSAFRPRQVIGKLTIRATGD